MNSIEFPNEFNSQLSLEGIAFRIKVEQVDWSPENLNVVESFHRCIICTEHETPDLMLVRIKSKECKANTVLDCPHVIDFTAMQRLSHSGGQPQTQIHFFSSDGSGLSKILRSFKGLAAGVSGPQSLSNSHQTRQFTFFSKAWTGVVNLRTSSGILIRCPLSFVAAIHCFHCCWLHLRLCQ